MSARAARLAFLYPAAIGAYAVLWVAVSHPGQYLISDLALSALVAVAGAVVVQGIAYAAARAAGAQEPAHLAAGVAVAALVIVFFSVPLASVFGDAEERSAAVLPAVILVLAVAATVVLRAPSRRPAATRLLALMSVLLLGSTLLRLVVSQARSRKMVAESRLVRKAQPLPSATRRPTRDVYLVVLDGHASSDVLRRHFGYENGAFEDSLRTLGFTIPRSYRSNYFFTALSLPSMLNFEHLGELAADARGSQNLSTPRHLIEHNRVARFFKAQGYEYVFFPSSWWSLSATSALADRQFDGHCDPNPLAALRRTELRATLVRATPFAGNTIKPTGGAAHPKCSFDGLARVADDPRPTFTFAHFLLPHHPYELDAACRPLAAEVNGKHGFGSAEKRAAYLAQLQCTDRMALAAVRSIVARSQEPPVILLLADHGTLASGPNWEGVRTAADVSDEFAAERFGAFAAFLVPGGGEALFADSLSAVNVFPRVLRHYFGADVPDRPNVSYISTPDRQFAFRAFDPPAAAVLTEDAPPE